MSSIPPNFLDLPWRWQMVCGRQMLVAGEDHKTVVLLMASHEAYLQTRDPKFGDMRSLDASDDVAKITAAAPEVRRHAQALIHGIDIGLVRIETDADETLANVLSQLREALARSGAV